MIHAQPTLGQRVETVAKALSGYVPAILLVGMAAAIVSVFTFAKISDHEREAEFKRSMERMEAEHDACANRCHAKGLSLKQVSGDYCVCGEAVVVIPRGRD